LYVKANDKWESLSSESTSFTQYVCPAEQFFYWYAFVLRGWGEASGKCIREGEM